MNHGEHRHGDLLRFKPTAEQRRCMGWCADIVFAWGKPSQWDNKHWVFDDLYYDDNGRPGRHAGGILSMSRDQIAFWTK